MEHGVPALTWVVLAAMIVVAKLGGEAALRLRQPAVLGELMAGVMLGNLLPGVGEIARGPEIAFAAELGVMLLLFQVGLESSVREMVKVAPRAGVVALIGVVLPSALGAGASALLLPHASTASVLKDAGALGTDEAKIILGAAVIDDVLGLIVLAIVSAVAVSGGSALDTMTLVRFAGAAIGFVVGALALGQYVFRGVYRFAAILRSPYVLGALSIAVCLVLAGASAAAGLAAIVGAYAAGLLLDDVSVRPFTDESGSGVQKVESFVAPIVAVFAPVFFVKTGMNVKLGGLDAPALLLGAALVVTGLGGKIAAGLGVRGGKNGPDRLVIGLGMTPRGEVGLIFADAGARLAPGGSPLFSPGIYAALVAAVFVTTLVAPPALAVRLRARALLLPKNETAPGESA